MSSALILLLHFPSLHYHQSLTIVMLQQYISVWSSEGMMKITKRGIQIYQYFTRWLKFLKYMKRQRNFKSLDRNYDDHVTECKWSRSVLL